MVTRGNLPNGAVVLRTSNDIILVRVNTRRALPGVLLVEEARELARQINEHADNIERDEADKMYRELAKALSVLTSETALDTKAGSGHTEDTNTTTEV